jgi:hypothetical protein
LKVCPHKTSVLASADSKQYIFNLTLNGFNIYTVVVIAAFIEKIINSAQMKPENL